MWLTWFFFYLRFSQMLLNDNTANFPFLIILQRQTTNHLVAFLLHRGLPSKIGTCPHVLHKAIALITKQICVFQHHHLGNWLRHGQTSKYLITNPLLHTSNNSDLNWVQHTHFQITLKHLPLLNFRNSFLYKIYGSNLTQDSLLQSRSRN